MFYSVLDLVSNDDAGLLPTELYDAIIAYESTAMSRAEGLLAETLQAEARHSADMRQAGRCS